MAGGFIVVAVVLLLVVLLGGSDAPAGPRPGPADTVTDTFGAALRSGSAAQVRAVACRGAQARLVRSVHGALGTSAATRQGVADVQGGVAVGRLTVSMHGTDVTATLALRQVGGAWCVAEFVPAG